MLYVSIIIFFWWWGGHARCRLSHSQLFRVSSPIVFPLFLPVFFLFFSVQSNILAINMYKKFGYSVYRTVIGYYSGEEDAYDMRKALVLFFKFFYKKSNSITMTRCRSEEGTLLGRRTPRTCGRLWCFFSFFFFGYYCDEASSLGEGENAYDTREALLPFFFWKLL